MGIIAQCYATGAREDKSIKDCDMLSDGARYVSERETSMAKTGLEAKGTDLNLQ